MQSLRPNPNATYRNIFDAFYKIIRYEGIWRPVRGINAVAGGAGPAHALYFACYEKMKKTFKQGSSTGQNTLATGEGRFFFVGSSFYRNRDYWIEISPIHV